jgi:hypothetical protein
VYLDRRFEEFVAEKIGREQLEGMDHRAKFQMGQYWETYMKREFSAGEDTQGEEEDFWVPVMGVQDSEDGRMRGGFLRVSR